MIKLLIFSSLFLVQPILALDEFSVNSKNLNFILTECSDVVSLSNLKVEINQILEMRRANRSKKWKYEFSKSFNLDPNIGTKNSVVSLDGLLLKDINPYDLEVVSQLTMFREASDRIWRSEYPILTKKENNKIIIRRKCLRLICSHRKQTEPINLSDKNTEIKCSNSLCASQSIFGEEQGVKILWAFLKFGVNLSPYSDIDADKSGFDNSDLDAILIAFKFLPENLVQKSMEGSGFFHFKKGKTLKIYGGDNTYANAFGAIFSSFDALDFNMKIAVISHEIGHRSSRIGNKNLAGDVEWKKISGFKEGVGNKFEGNPNEKAISKYARLNSSEDFAETFNMYRFNPRRLKEISIERYTFMKEKVFEQMEFDQEKCKGQVNLVKELIPNKSEVENAK